MYLSWLSGMGDDEVTALVVDNGSGMCKVGIAGEDVPQAIFSSVIGKACHQGAMANTDRDYYVGSLGTKAQEWRSVLTLQYPIEYVVVTNWDDMEKVWKEDLVIKLI